MHWGSLLFIPFFLLQIFAGCRAQKLNSASTNGLLVGKGSEVREAHNPPILPEPVLAPLSHSSPISPSELNFSKRRRRRSNLV